MRQNPSKIDRASVEYATGSSSRIIKDCLKRAEDILSDANKAARAEKCQCAACFYVRSRIGGAAMTHRDCGICGKDQLYSSTSTDVICMECARTNGLCKHCGGDIDMKPRRKPYPFMEAK